MKDADLLGHVEEQGYVMINSQAFSKMGRNRRAALMLHELIHSVGGTELDAEAIERWAYPDDVTGPTEEDHVMFQRNPRGRYTTLDLNTFHVTLNRTKKVITRLPVP